MKNNQQGLSHIIIVALIVLVIGVISFAAYRVGVSTSSQNQGTGSDQQPLVSDLKVEDEQETVKVPKEEEKTEPVKEVTKPTPAPDEKTEVKKDKIYLNISLVSATQDGDKVNVHSTIEKAVTGTCNFKLYQEGYEKIYTSKKITESKTCKGSLDISDLPTYNGWSLHVWFDGSDGKTYAYQEEKAISLTNPN